MVCSLPSHILFVLKRFGLLSQFCLHSCAYGVVSQADVLINTFFCLNFGVAMRYKLTKMLSALCFSALVADVELVICGTGWEVYLPIVHIPPKYLCSTCNTIIILESGVVESVLVIYHEMTCHYIYCGVVCYRSYKRFDTMIQICQTVLDIWSMEIWLSGKNHFIFRGIRIVQSKWFLLSMDMQ